MNESHLRNVIEAALLAAGKPLQPAELVDLFDEGARPQVQDIQAALAALTAEYSNRGIEIKETAAGFRIQVRREMANEISRLWPERPARYSRALLETLALIAYRQPITRAEIEAVRGVAVNPNILKTVIERNWVRVVGHRDVPGRPELLGTTRDFLDYFGLKSLDELPPLAELKVIGDIKVQFDLPDPGPVPLASDANDAAAGADTAARVEGDAVDGAAVAEVVAAADGAAVGEVVATVDGAVVAEVVAVVDGAAVPEVVAVMDGAAVAEVAAAVDGATVAEVGDAVDGATVAEVGDAVDGATVAEVGDAVDGAIVAEVGDAVDGAIVAEVVAAVAEVTDMGAGDAEAGAENAGATTAEVSGAAADAALDVVSRATEAVDTPAGIADGAAPVADTAVEVTEPAVGVAKMSAEVADPVTGVVDSDGEAVGRAAEVADTGQSAGDHKKPTVTRRGAPDSALHEAEEFAASIDAELAAGDDDGSDDDELTAAGPGSSELVAGPRDIDD